ncbi:hypothetical protein PAHAL_8G233200 [Panicum hallii]|uniref:Uncharacterized protein n=1 Tax=Panicum hallii TaxID=206008 RepID=A0A2T8IA08_9POAL|nr:hypothetical protein PAHAL_8G233200 [Panicum hallii]
MAKQERLIIVYAVVPDASLISQSPARRMCARACLHALLNKVPHPTSCPMGPLCATCPYHRIQDACHVC